MPFPTRFLHLHMLVELLAHWPQPVQLFQIRAISFFSPPRPLRCWQLVETPGNLSLLPTHKRTSFPPTMEGAGHPSALVLLFSEQLLPGNFARVIQWHGWKNTRVISWVPFCNWSVQSVESLTTPAVTVGFFFTPDIVSDTCNHDL